MSKKKMVFAKKSGAEKRLDRFESNIQYVPVTDKAFDGERLEKFSHDEMGQWAAPSKESMDEYMKFVEESKRAITFTVKK